MILGSAPLQMQSGLSESLAGRFEPIRITHWTFPEMSAAFDLTLDEYNLLRRLSGRRHSHQG